MFVGGIIAAALLAITAFVRGAFLNGEDRVEWVFGDVIALPEGFGRLPVGDRAGRASHRTPAGFGHAATIADARKLATEKSDAGGDGSQKRQRASTHGHTGTPNNSRPLGSAQ